MFFFSFSILSLKTVVFIRFRDHSLHSIDLTGCCILEEERIILSIALCSGGVLSLRIALSVPQPRLTKKPSFSKPKNNFSYNNNKNKDKNMGNEMFCFVCGQTNHLAKNCFQCNIPKEYYENLINKIQDKIKNAFIKTIFQKHGKFKTLISLS